jgi:hypothetical protein
MRFPGSSFVHYFLFAACIPALAASSSVDADRVQVQRMVLFQDSNPGDAADAGLHFKMEPGWRLSAAKQRINMRV